jgi:hypothetical protein
MLNMLNESRIFLDLHEASAYQFARSSGDRISGDNFATGSVFLAKPGHWASAV